MISPKVIDIGSNRIETTDKLYRNLTDKDSKTDYRYTDEILYYTIKNYYNETSRFPTQLFTNIDLEYNGIKKIK